MIGRAHICLRKKRRVAWSDDALANSREAIPDTRPIADLEN